MRDGGGQSLTPSKRTPSRRQLVLNRNTGPAPRGLRASLGFFGRLSDKPTAHSVSALAVTEMSAPGGGRLSLSPCGSPSGFAPFPILPRIKTLKEHNSRTGGGAVISRRGPVFAGRCSSHARIFLLRLISSATDAVAIPAARAILIELRTDVGVMLGLDAEPHESRRDAGFLENTVRKRRAFHCAQGRRRAAHPSPTYPLSAPVFRAFAGLRVAPE